MRILREALLIVLYGLCSVSDITERKIYIVYPAVYSLTVLIIAIAEGVKPAEIALSLVPGVLFYFAAKLSKGKVGMGDVYLVLAAGPALLISSTVECITYALLGAAIFGGIGLMTGRFRADSRIPFAPFLLAAAVIVCIV